MREYPYEFNKDDAFRFAKEVGAQAKVNGKELRFTYCPYCRGGRSHDKDTFAINLENGTWNCKRDGCGRTGNMLILAKDFDFSLGTEYDAYYRPRKTYRQFKTPKEPIKPKPAAVQYLENRGISERTAERYEITTRNDNDKVLVFPFYDENGKLVFIKYRKTDFDKERDKNKEWAETNGKPILFGMKQCTKGKTLIITEGQIDSLSVAEAGYTYAVSVPTGAKGTTWIPNCWDWVNTFQKIIVFGDHEKGHITLLDDISKRFSLRIFHVQPEDYKDCKDANEILRKYGKQQIVNCIENAVQIPVRDVVELADVPEIDIYALEKCRTSIRQLDKLLYGGLPFGGVHLVTGKAGEGKSTLASQILISAREQGYKCFAYSGELPNTIFKSWMNFQVAGRKHIFEYQDNPYGDIGYNISQTNKALISDWYRHYVYIYDNFVIDGVETSSLLKITEKVIQQYGVRVILMDNLMTAMTLDNSRGSDQYERQTEFVNQLRSLAVKYNVMIILVAHKRKNGYGGNENDEVAGSSNIVNLAMVTIAYERDKECDESQRLLKVSKNRLFGRTDTEGYVLNFNERSKRIYGDGDDLDVEYSWNPDSDGFIDADDVVFD